jgi:hypothetical protein
MPLPTEHLLDELATAYVQAIAAAGSATIAVSRDYGVDGTLKHIVKVKDRFIESGFPVEFQLKGTASAAFDNAYVNCDLKVRNYDLVVTRAPFATPIYLFLVCFGPDADSWMRQERDQLVLRARGFWWSQTGAPTDNSSTVRIRIPISNRLTSSAIEDMLVSSKERFR